MSDEIEVFLSKVDAFAQGLNQTEQAMLAHLVSDEATDDDVAGFSFEGWPAKVIDIAPRRIANMGNYTDAGRVYGRVNYTDAGRVTGSNLMSGEVGKGEI